MPDTIVDLGRELSRTEKVSVSTVHTCPDQRHRRETSEMFPGHTMKKIKEGDMTGRGWEGSALVQMVQEVSSQRSEELGKSTPDRANYLCKDQKAGRRWTCSTGSQGGEMEGREQRRHSRRSSEG